MLCPHCGATTINFGTWSRGRNAFRWTCPHCQTALKANRATWLSFLAALPIVLAILVAVLALQSRGYIPNGGVRRALLIGVVIAVLPVAFIGYKRGGYVER